MIRAVLFDAAGTLLYVHPSVGDIYANEAARFGARISADDIDTAFRAAWRALRPGPDGRTPFHTSEKIERAWWRRLVEHVFEATCGPAVFGNRFDAFFESLYLRFERPDAWRLFDDVMPTLDALRDRGVPIAIVSNWDSRLPRLLKAMGIAERFQFILTSAEAGVAKPSPEIFRQAVARLGTPAYETLHIGDSILDDVRAAKAAGLQGLLIDRDGEARHNEPGIRSLTEAIGYLE